MIYIVLLLLNNAYIFDTIDKYDYGSSRSNFMSIIYYFVLSGGQYGAHTDPHNLIDEKEETEKYKGDGDR